jgi:predicted RNA-binding Zn-ribbon protein involved in translation (DUF1610 family)
MLQKVDQLIFARKKLLDAGANPYTKVEGGPGSGLTAVDIAKSKQNQTLVSLLQDATIVKPHPSANPPATIPTNNTLGPKKASPQISCPKCGASMIYTAAKCRQCGNRMIKI